MPVINNIDNKGAYYKWGNEGKKYYYDPQNERSRIIARDKAIKQGMAINIAKSKVKRYD